MGGNFSFDTLQYNNYGHSQWGAYNGYSLPSFEDKTYFSAERV